MTVVADDDLRDRIKALEQGRPTFDRHGFLIGKDYLPIQARPLPDPASLAGRKMAKDEAEREATLAAARAREEQIRLEREQAEAEAERIWEANAPRRQAALDALPSAEAEAAVIRSEYHAAEERLRELRRQASE